MSIPKRQDFPEDAEFFILEFDVPLVHIGSKWFNWYGGKPKEFNVEFLKVDNNWPAPSFEEWLELIRKSIPQPKIRDREKDNYLPLQNRTLTYGLVFLSILLPAWAIRSYLLIDLTLKRGGDINKYGIDNLIVSALDFHTSLFVFALFLISGLVVKIVLSKTNANFWLRKYRYLLWVLVGNSLLLLPSLFT